MLRDEARQLLAVADVIRRDAAAVLNLHGVEVDRLRRAVWPARPGDDQATPPATATASHPRTRVWASSHSVAARPICELRRRICAR